MAEYNANRVTYGQNTYIFNDKAARDAILDIIADNGKNLIPDISYGRPKGDPCPYVDIPIRATAGSYMLSIEEVTSDDTDADTCLVTIFSNGSVVEEDLYLERGSDIAVAVSLYSPADTIRIYASDTASHSSGDKVYVLRPMLCPRSYSVVDPTYAFYTPGNRELAAREQIEASALTELIDSGPKNVVNWSANSTTISGVTFTVNSDKTVSTSGTASARAQFSCPFTVPASLKAGRYVLSGCPPGGGNASGATTLYALYIWDITAGARLIPNYKDDNGNALEFDWTPDSTHTYNISVDIRNGTNATGLIFKPMISPIEYWKVTKAYQPYRPSYQQLYEMVKALQNGS